MNADRTDKRRSELDKLTRKIIGYAYTVRVVYDGQPVGDFWADLLVGDSVLVEWKATKALDEIHYVQCMNYLKATGLSVCLLIKFGTPKVQIKRIVHRY